MRWTSFFAGLLVLTALDAVLSSGAAAGRAGGALNLASSAITHLMSPASPLIPDLRTSTSAASSSTTSSTVTGLPAIVQLAPTSAAAAAATTKTA